MSTCPGLWMLFDVKFIHILQDDLTDNASANDDFP